MGDSRERAVRIIERVIVALLLGIVFLISIADLRAFYLFFISLLLWMAKMLLEKRWDVAKTPLDLPLLAFITCALIFSFKTVDSKLSWPAFIFIIIYAVSYYLFVSNIRDKKYIRYFGLLIFIASFYLSYIGIYEYLLKEGGRIASIYFHPNILGHFLVLALPVNIGLCLLPSKRLISVSLAVFLPFMVAAIFLSVSIGSWVGTGIALLVFFELMVQGKRKGIIRISIFAILLIFLFTVNHLYPSFFSSIISHKIGTFNSRIYIWESSWMMIKDSYFLGNGLNTFTSLYPSYRLWGGETIAHAHNLPLHLLVETGIPGLLIFLWFIGVLFKQLADKYRNASDREGKILAAAFLSSWAGWCVHNLIEVTILGGLYILTLWFWIWVSLSMALIKTAPGGKEKR